MRDRSARATHPAQPDGDGEIGLDGFIGEIILVATASDLHLQSPLGLGQGKRHSGSDNRLISGKTCQRLSQRGTGQPGQTQRM